MDPITATHLVQHRTQYLQRIAEQVRRERKLRSTSTSTAAAEATPPASAEATPPASARPAEPRRVPAPNPAQATGRAPAEPAV